METCSIYLCKNPGDIHVGYCILCSIYYVCKKHKKLVEHKSCKPIYFKIAYDKRLQAKECGLYYSMGEKKWFSSNPNAYEAAIECGFAPIEE